MHRDRLPLRAPESQISYINQRTRGPTQFRCYPDSISDALQLSVSSRPALPDDEPLLFRIYRSTREAELQAIGWNAAQQDAFLQMQYNVRRRGYAESYPSAEHSILISGELAVGSMIVWRSSTELRLVDIALLPEHRGRGIGAAFLSILIREAAAARVPLRLSVLRGNPALRLYQRSGFVVSAEDAMYLEMEHDPR